MLELTHRFEDALVYTHTLHKNQKRKGTSIPYIAHLLSVTALVLENGGNEDAAIAALLHDAVEDQGGYATLEDIRSRYGANVAEIVEGCTDAFTIPKPPWRERKENYLHHLQSASPSIQLVSLADKLHNATTILADLQSSGSAVWNRFSGGKEGTLWYYNKLAETFQANVSNPMVGRLVEKVKQIDQIATMGNPPSNDG
jgi:GTP pyrophosphokinase